MPLPASWVAGRLSVKSRARTSSALTETTGTSASTPNCSARCRRRVGGVAGAPARHSGRAPSAKSASAARPTAVSSSGSE